MPRAVSLVSFHAPRAAPLASFPRAAWERMFTRAAGVFMQHDAIDFETRRVSDCVPTQRVGTRRRDDCVSTQRVVTRNNEADLVPTRRVAVNEVALLLTRRVGMRNG